MNTKTAITTAILILVALWATWKWKKRQALKARQNYLKSFDGGIQNHLVSLAEETEKFWGLFLQRSQEYKDALQSSGLKGSRCAGGNVWNIEVGGEHFTLCHSDTQVEDEIVRTLSAICTSKTFLNQIWTKGDEVFSVLVEEWHQKVLEKIKNPGER